MTSLCCCQWPNSARFPVPLMPPALERLLASSSARRPVHWTPPRCCTGPVTRRYYSKEREPFVKYQWPRWSEAREDKAEHDSAQHGIEAEDEAHSSQGQIEYNAAYWATTLAHQERLKRLQGIRVIWKACCFRGYRLPTEDTKEARFLWGTFIKNPALVTKVVDHAAEIFQETKTIYPHLYELTLHYWLPRNPKLALEIHHQMLLKLRLLKLPLRSLARRASSSFKLPAYEALMEIYRNSNERDLYDEIVLPLVEKGKLNMARRWHTLCTFRDDRPSELVALHPVIQIFSVEASTISRSKQGVGKYNQELTRRLLGRDTAPVRFEDSFCARMFATRTFTPASIIQGLVMVGVNEIGPQAVRAMASRTRPIEELPMRFEDLKTAGIALQGSVFSLALEKFALEQKWHLVRSMLESDQHPDVFGDADLQRKLLEYYLDQEDFGQAQRTLAILTLFHKDFSGESWNLLLQVYIQQSGPQHVVGVLRDMQAHSVMLSTESVTAIKSLLRRRQRGRKPGLSTRGRFDDLRFVTRVFIHILESGTGAISPLAWREIICRFGMLGRFRELKRLLLWLLCWYAPRGNRQFADLPESPFLGPATAKLRAAYPERNHYFHFPTAVAQRESPFHPIRLLFKPALQQGLISWGFRAGLLPNAHLEQSLFGPTLQKKHYRHRLWQKETLKRLDWSIGLRTVVQLRDLGVHVHRYAVVKALQMQFLVMFGRGRSDRKDNRVMEKANSIRYASYVEEVNKIWGQPLFRAPQLFGQGAAHQHMWHPRLGREVERRLSISLKEALGRNWQRDIGKDEHSGKHDMAENDDVGLEELQKQFTMQAESSKTDLGIFNRNTKSAGSSRSPITTESKKEPGSDDIAGAS